MFLQNILIKENNNYTIRILHSHTDHYPNMATNWKKLTTKELNRSIACHRSKQRKKKNHVLAHKTHHSTVLGSITFPTENLQSNLTCFHKVGKKDFATVLDAVLWFSSHLHQFGHRKEHLYLLNRWQGRTNS